MNLSHWERMSDEELALKLKLLREVVKSGMLSPRSTENELNEISLIEATLEKRHGSR